MAERADALTKKYDAARTPSEFREVAEEGMDLASKALAGGGGEPARAKAIAEMAMDAAWKSGDAELEKKATIALLEASKH